MYPVVQESWQIPSLLYNLDFYSVPAMPKQDIPQYTSKLPFVSKLLYWTYESEQTKIQTLFKLNSVTPTLI